MSIRFFNQWLWLFIMLGLLTACGGGAFEEDTGTTDTPGETVDDDFTGVGFSIGVQSLLPSSSSTTVKFTTFIADADREGEIAPNVDLNITVHPEGTAKLENVFERTDQNGDGAFTVSHPGSGNVSINISGAGSFKGGFNIPLYFGADVTADVITKGIVPADGKTPAEITVFARDWAGVGISGMGVNFSFPLDSFAVHTASGSTNEKGEFTTGITNTVPQNTKVTPFAGGMAAGPLTLTFGTSLVATALERLDLIVKNKTVPPNGASTAKVVVVARGASEAPVPNIPVNISSNSATAQLKIGTESKTLFINGDTGTEGSFELEITNTVEETVELTATTIDSKTIGSFKTTIDFASEQSDIKVGDIKLDPPINNDQPANGTDQVTLQGWVSDVNGKPIVGQEVSIIVSGGSAQIAEEKLTTNASGRFSTTMTDAIVEEFKATAVIGDVSSNEVTIKFVSAPGAPGAAEFVNLSVSPTQQIANGIDQITLRVEVRDSSNTPLKGVEVSIASPSNTAIFDNIFDDNPNPTVATTGEAGAAVFKVSNTVPETLTVTATAQDKIDTKNFTFTKVDSSTFDVKTTPPEQPADGQAAIMLVATFKDVNGDPISGADIEFISSPSHAKIALPTGTTNPLGEFSTTVTSTVPEKDIKITPVINVENIVDSQGAVVKDIVGDAKLITFFPVGTGVTLTANVVNDNQPANGTDAIQIDVTATKGGQAVPNVPLIVTTDEGEAVVDLSENNVNENGEQVTNEKGYFKIKITSSKPKSFVVNILAKDTSVAAPPQPINFIPDPGNPTNVELIVENAPQPADSLSEITLVVIATDDTGKTVPEVEVELIADSDQIKIDQPTGKTDALGKFRTTVVTATDMTNTLVSPLIVNVTPVAGGIIGEPIPVIFTPVPVPIPAFLDLSVTNNNAEVGQEATLMVVAWDDNGSPMEGVTVKLSVAPGDEPPNVKGSTIFGSNGSEGKTAENTGVFETTLKNTQAGTVKVTAAALGIDGAPILNSNSVDVTFRGEDGPGDVKEVSDLSLITSSPQLGSEGNADGVTITAIVLNKANNLVEGAVISFSADSGEILPLTVEGSSLPGMTNASGQAQARLTTVGNSDNRTIKVTATVPTTSGKTREATIDIEVTGTTIIVSGQDTIILGNTVDIGIFMKDSAGKGIGGQTLTVTSSLGNTFDNPSPITSISGQVNIKLTASVPGQDTITVTKAGSVSGELEINISDDNFTLTSSPPESGMIEIELKEAQEFLVHWDKRGTPQAFESINISSTRGTLSANSVITDTNGDARFTIRADNSGPAVITATAEVDGGPSKQVNVEFIAKDADSMTLQANPITLAVNSPGTETEQSEITAVVWDPENNLVKGKRINFTLEDVTGGRLFPSSGVTDSFGRASTVYFAGTSSSAAGGVKVTATVVEEPTVTAFVNLTVAAKSLFVTLGTGNEMEDDPPTRYKIPYTVLVNDANGVAITDTDVVLSVLPIQFAKGWWYYFPSFENFEIWAQKTTSTCQNEDTLSPDEGNHFNGILDAGEDLNNNGTLEPGNVATFDSGGKLKTVETDANGFADFFIVYAQEYATWVKVRLTATVSVAGSEGSDQKEFWLSILASDLTNKTVSPPGQPSPFGRGGAIDWQEDGLILLNGRLDTEDLNNNGVLDDSEDGAITKITTNICSPSSITPTGKALSELTEEELKEYATPIAGAPNCNPRPGQLDTEDTNRNGFLDTFYINSCNDTL